MRFWALFAFVLGACAGAPARASPRAEERAYLLLVDDGEAVRTEWVDASGVPQGRADGAVVGVGPRLFRFESRVETVSLAPCEVMLGGVTSEDAGTSGTIASAVLVGLADAPTVVLARAPSAADVASYAHHEMRHRVLAALGHRLVVLTTRDRNACAAAGERAIEVTAYDLSSGARIAGNADGSRLPEALAAMRASDPLRAVDCLSAGDLAVRWIAWAPGLTARGIVTRQLYAAGPLAGSCGTLDAPSSTHEWAVWLEAPASEIPDFGPDDALPAAVLARAVASSAVGVTWVDAERAPLGDAFALAAP